MAVSNNIIGGTASGAGNLISGNLNRGIALDGADNIVQGNLVGTDVTGLNPLGNGHSGIEIGGSGNLVGGTNNGSANIIAFNGNAGDGTVTTNGVDIQRNTTSYAILGNSIFDNAGLGIDVNEDGVVTPGFPVLTVVSNTGTSTVIKGTHTPSTTFRLELFLNPAPDHTGYGEGKTLLTSTFVTTDAGGNFTLTWPTALTPGLVMTATADGMSEFSKDQLVTAAGNIDSWASSSSGKWETGSNWSLNVPPYIGDSLVLITNAGTKTVTAYATTASGFPTTLTISNLVISAPGAATNTLLLAQGVAGTPLHIVGNLSLSPGGALVVNDGALSLDGQFGSASYSVDSALTLNGGLVAATNAQVLIGNNGSGSMTVSNGTFQAYYPVLGLNSGANGTWNIAGGSNIVLSTFDIADNLTATGKLVMTGGLLSTPGCYVGLFGNASVLVSNGNFQCSGTVDVASEAGAVGNFIAAGGTSTIGNLIIGESTGATGAVLVTGTGLLQVTGPVTENGSITVAGGVFAATNDNSFLSHVTVSNGTFLARDVFLGDSENGLFTLAGNGLVALPGSFNGFNVGANGGTGMVSQIGGLILLTNTDLNIGGLFSPAVGQMTISNGTTLANRVFVGGQGGGNGTLEMDGGMLITSNLQVYPASQFTFNQGTLQTRSGVVSNGAPFQVGDGTHAATYQLLGGVNTFTKGLRIAANGTLAGSGTISGDLLLNSGSQLHLQLGGYTPVTQFDVINVTGGATLGGTLAVSLSNNFQAIVTNGASFTVLTSDTPLTGAFANVPSGGVLTTTDGYAQFTVLYAGSTTVRLTNLQIVEIPQPAIIDISLAGSNLLINGTNGQAGRTYYTLMSTNVAQPLRQWTPVATNVLSTGGSFSIIASNAVYANAMQQFYILQVAR